MAKLKDIKSRLQSVQSTKKITSAMMMVSSAKQKKAERLIHNLRPYEITLQRILNPLLKGDEKETLPSPYMENRAVKRVAIIAFSSNTGLAGRFNDNVIDKLFETIEEYKSLGKENILLYLIGDKVTKAALGKGLEIKETLKTNADKPSYVDSRRIAKELMKLFMDKKIDRVEIIYHQFKSSRSQLLTREQLLPIYLSDLEKEASKITPIDDDYIIEPDKGSLLKHLIPKVIQIKLFASHTDSVTSEHAARVTAMQIATDNADDLSEELRLEYNKLRQQSITNELLDIMGGTIGR